MSASRSGDAAPVVVAVDTSTSWITPALPLAGVALVCVILAAILSRGLRRSAPGLRRWPRIALSATLPVLPIVALSILAVAGLESAPWSAKVRMLGRPLGFAAGVGFLFCFPAAWLASLESRSRNVRDIFD